MDLGLHISRSGGVNCGMSHILYADDTLIICEANKSQFLYLKRGSTSFGGSDSGIQKEACPIISKLDLKLPICES